MVISRTRTTQWNLVFHYVSIALMMVSGVLLVPLYLHHIPLGLYGAWLATGNVLMWLTAVDPGLTSILQQRVGDAYGQNNHQSIRGMIAAGLLLSACATLVLLCLGYLATRYIPSWLNLASSVDQQILLQAFWVAVIGSCLLLFSYSVTAINQGLQSSLGIGCIYVAVHILDILLILALIFAGFGLMALAYSALFRGIGMLLGNVVYLGWRLNKDNIGFSISSVKIVELLKLMPFTFVAQASSIVASNIDAFVVARFLGADVVPVLVLTRKAFDICRMIVSRPIMAIMPALSHLAGERDIDKAKQVLIRLVRIMMWLLLLITSGLMSLNDDFVRIWVGDSLFAGVEINALLCAGLLVGVMTLSLSNLCMALGDIKGASLAILAQSVIFIALVIPGTKYLGLTGIVLAPLVAALLVGFWYFPQSLSAILKIDLEERKLLIGEFMRSIFPAVAVGYLFWFFKAESIIEFMVFVVLFALAYGMLLSLISVAFRTECVQLYKKLFKRFCTTDNNAN